MRPQTGDMAPEKISTIEGLTAWLVGRSDSSRHSDAVAIVQRTACRVFPIYASEEKSPLAERRYVTDLPILRMLLTQPFTGEVPLLWASTEVYDSSASSTSSAARFSAMAASNFVATLSVVPNAISAVEFAIACVSDLSSSAGTDIWREIQSDALCLEDGGNLYSARLWQGAVPSWFLKADSEFRQHWQLRPQYLTDENGSILETEDGLLLVAGDPIRVLLTGSHWDFWIRWWDGVLSSQQINWDLQRAVALIPDNDWPKGPTHIARIIARLEEQFDLRIQIADLAAKLREVESQAMAQSASDRLRGHNHPPELIGAQVAVRQEVALAVIALDEAEAEVAKTEPDPSVLKRVGLKLLNAAKAVAAYCVGLADIAAKKSAEVVGETGTKAFIWTVAAHYAQLDGVAKSLLEFAAKLAAGG